MRPILPGQLWIGNAADTRSPESIAENQLAAVVDLAAEEPIPKLPRTLLYARFPLVDGSPDASPFLRLAIDMVVSLLQEKVPTLLCCGAGMSRSPAVAAAALSLFQGGSPEEHLRRITSGWPHDVSPQLWGEVQRCLQRT